MMWKNIPVAVLAAALLVMPAQRASALENEDLLALVAMPLAVAAVSEVTDVPMNQLFDVVSLLNDAAVPPPQFIEVVRYVPVAFVVDYNVESAEPDFVEFVRVRTSQGVIGTALVASIEERFRTYEPYDLGDINLLVTRPRVVDIDDDFIPLVVRNRVAEVRNSHPHGGPPGQLKKAAGVQTGAEIVHGSRRDRDNRVSTTRVRVKSDEKAVKQVREKQRDRVENARRGGGPVTHARGNSGKGQGGGQEKAGKGGKENKGNKGHGGGKGKGKG